VSRLVVAPAAIAAEPAARPPAPAAAGAEAETADDRPGRPDVAALLDAAFGPEPGSR
jgi:hypothetical protein